MRTRYRWHTRLILDVTDKIDFIGGTPNSTQAVSALNFNVNQKEII